MKNNSLDIRKLKIGEKIWIHYIRFSSKYRVTKDIPPIEVTVIFCEYPYLKVEDKNGKEYNSTTTAFFSFYDVESCVEHRNYIIKKALDELKNFYEINSRNLNRRLMKL